MSPITKQKAPKDRGDPKKRNKKDPRAPKRNMSAFLFYSNVRRHDVKKAHPNLSFSEIAKVLSEMWRLAPTEEKREYIEKARVDKIRYFREKKAYDDSQPRERKDKSKVSPGPSVLPSAEHLLPPHLSPQLSPDFDNLSLPILSPSASLFLSPSISGQLSTPSFPLPGIQHGLVHNAAITMAQFEDESALGDFAEYGSSGGIPK